MLNALKI